VLSVAASRMGNKDGRSDMISGEAGDGVAWIMACHHSLILPLIQSSVEPGSVSPVFESCCTFNLA
jgi:hypothetical protein